jgi:hypothetical protein
MFDLGPFLELDAGDGAIGEEGWVAWVLLNTMREGELLASRPFFRVSDIFPFSLRVRRNVSWGVWDVFAPRKLEGVLRLREVVFGAWEVTLLEELIALGLQLLRHYATGESECRRCVVAEVVDDR